MTLPVRVGTLLIAFLAVVGGAIFVVIHFFLAGPQVIAATAATTPGQVNITLQEDPQNSVTNRPDWVSYFIEKPGTSGDSQADWVHTTLFQVPAGSQVNVTILGYDGCTPLRNPYWGQVTGTFATVDGQKKRNVELVDGKPVSFLNSYTSCSVGHTFSIPGIGLNVPVASVTSYKLNSSLCSPPSPCTSGPHTTVTFSFMAPKTPGDYFWQCRIPCGLGYLDGFGGPMQTIGYMTGQMEVAS